MMLARLISVALLELAFGHVAIAHDAHFSAGQPGDPRKPSRTIEVTMNEQDMDHMSYTPASLEVERGEQVKFVIKNTGAFTHEFVLADTKANLKHAELMRRYPDMEHDDPNAKTIAPQGSAEILWQFTRKGTFEYACLIPGHRQAGMVGTITVK